MMIIGVDTGNRCIKTAQADPFSAGLNRHFGAPPIVATDTLFFEGNYYSFSEAQDYHRQDKTEDDCYFILTLAAIAREVIMKSAIRQAAPGKAVAFPEALREAVRSRALPIRELQGRAKTQEEYQRLIEQAPAAFTQDIFLSVGLPPSDMKTQSASFKKYFMRDGAPLWFAYNNIKFNIRIVDVCVSPQGFAAIFPNDLFQQVCSAPQTYIIDIGGYTTDVALVVNKRIDTNFYVSLDFGVIHMCNSISDAIRRDYQQNINGVLIEAILRGESVGRPEIEAAVRGLADVYARKIIAALRDLRVDLDLSLPVLVGGGVQLLRKSLEEAISRDEIFVVPDIRANAIGYEVVANRIAMERNQTA